MGIYAVHLIVNEKSTRDDEPFFLSLLLLPFVVDCTLMKFERFQWLMVFYEKWGRVPVGVWPWPFSKSDETNIQEDIRAQALYSRYFRFNGMMNHGTIFPNQSEWLWRVWVRFVCWRTPRTQWKRGHVHKHYQRAYNTESKSAHQTSLKGILCHPIPASFHQTHTRITYYFHTISLFHFDNRNKKKTKSWPPRCMRSGERIMFWYDREIL